MKYARIRAIEYHLPENKLTNEELSTIYPEWSIDKIYSKTGINSRCVSKKGETALDLAEAACAKLFSTNQISSENVQALVFCTQTPDHILPPNSPLLQARLGINKSVMAFDISHGCSGFVYSIALAKSLIESNAVENVLVVTADTYSKYINDTDRSVRTIFGDAASATLVVSEESGKPFMDNFIFNTDGSGGKNLIIPEGGTRLKETYDEKAYEYVKADGLRNLNNIYMNGPEIFTFSMRTVPAMVQKVLELAAINLEDIDKVIFHQASAMMLDNLKRKCKIPDNKFITYFDNIGNTVSSTIPIAMKHALANGQLQKGEVILIAGFGVGYSSAAGIVTL